MTIRNLCAALTLACFAAGANAAEWTRTVDMTEPKPSEDRYQGRVAATAEAFWIGPRDAFDPGSGSPLSPFDLPERLTVDGWETLALNSSRRGELWSRPHDRFAGLVTHDAANTSWSVDPRSAQLTRLAKDGASVKQWTAAGLGFPEHRLKFVHARIDSAGAVLVLTPNADGDKLVVSIDQVGRVLRQQPFALPCDDSVEVRDDRLGGHYELCPNRATIWRRAIDAAQHWREPLSLPLPPGGAEVTPEGGLLTRVFADGPHYGYFDRHGTLLFRTRAYAASAARGGAWFLDLENGRLSHVNAYGQPQAQVTLPGGALSYQLAAHDNGNVLVKLLDGSDNYAFIRSDGHQIKVMDDIPDRLRDVSRIEFNGGELRSNLNWSDQVLIDDYGVASSAPISRSNAHAESRANASTVCIRDDEVDTSHPIEWNFHPRVRCIDRATGTPTGMNVVWRSEPGTAAPLPTLVDVASHVRVYRGSEMLHYTRNGTLERTVSLPGARSIDVHPRRGTLALMWTGLTTTLAHFGMDGTQTSWTPINIAGTDGDVFLSESGDGFVVTRWTLLAPAKTYLLRHDTAANRDYQRELSSAVAGYAIIDIDTSPNGVQLLLQAPFDVIPEESAVVPDQTRPTRLLVLSPDLATLRATIDLPGAWYGHARLYPATNDDPRVALAGPTGLSVHQVDSLTGTLRNKRLLPIGDVDTIRTSLSRRPFEARLRQVRYDITLDGRVRFLDRDSTLKRDVLRIAEPDGQRFGGPIRQTALSGSWYSPNSTGQGLIVELLNNATQLFAAWHTYAPEGGNSLAKQQWLTVQGDVGSERGAITLPIYRNSGGRFDLAGRTDATPVGSAELVFTSCDRLEFWYRIGDEIGAMPLQRLTPRTQSCNNGTSSEAPADTAPTIDLTGPWYDPSRSGQGLAVSASGARFNQFFAGWFTYDADAADDTDAQHWFTLQGANPSRYGETISASIFRTTGGSRSGEPTRNTHRVGVAQLTVHDCANATLEYVFDDSAVAGPFADRMRPIPLRRLGNCPN